jgi:hypothetical protein
VLGGHLPARKKLHVKECFLRFISRDCKDQSAIIRIEYLVDVPGACVAFDFRTIALARTTFSLDFEMAELTRSPSF